MRMQCKIDAKKRRTKKENDPVEKEILKCHLHHPKKIMLDVLLEVF